LESMRGYGGGAGEGEIDRDRREAVFLVGGK
jgi:hypothetical protein